MSKKVEIFFSKVQNKKALPVIRHVLMEALTHGLTVEVLYTAFSYLKASPESSIEEALNYGLNEWVK